MVKMLGKTQVLIMIVLLLTYFSFAGVALADTEVSGLISQDTIWDKEGSPYIVKGHILVDTGVILTITEGVDIKFDGEYYMQIKGKLLVKGLPNEHVNFSPSKGIKLNQTQIELKGNNNILEYCNFDSLSSGILLKGDYNLINCCNIKNSGHGVFIYQSDNNAIVNCNINNNTTNIMMYVSKYNKITNCNISNNKTTNDGSILLQQMSNYNQILYCNINDNPIGIKFGYDCDINTVNNNNIYNNSYNIKVDAKTTKTIDCTNNYWGLTDSSEISMKIYDFYDDFNLSKVNYEPYLFVPYGSDLVSSNYPGGTYNNSITVELSVSTGSEIKYTLDGSDPAQSGILYTNPILIDKTLDLKAVSVKDDVCSDISTYSYVIESYGSVQGYVYGITNLSNIQVSLGEYISNTNQTGFYKFDNIPLGKYTLKANYTFCKCNPIDLTIINSEPMNQDLELIPGDFNGDNKIDLFDLMKLARNYGR